MICHINQGKNSSQARYFGKAKPLVLYALFVNIIIVLVILFLFLTTHRV
jgi:hypothetical protein